MKRLAILSAVALSAACAMSQEKPQPPQGARPEGLTRPVPQMQGPGQVITRVLASKENLKKIGVEDEAVCSKICDGLDDLGRRSGEIEKKVRELSREQAKLLRELIADKSRDVKEYKDKIDEVAKLRAEQGRLLVQSVELLRENLSAEQLKEAHKLIMERGRMRGGDPRRGVRREGAPDGNGKEPPRRGKGRGGKPGANGAAQRAEPAPEG